MKRKRLAIGLGVLAAICTGGYWYVKGPWQNSITKALASHHIKMTSPDIERVPTKRNPLQTLREYKLLNSIGEPGKLYIQPLGELTKEEEAAVEKTAQFLAIAFNAETEIVEKIADDVVPPEKRRTRNDQEQFDAHYVLYEVLKDSKPADGVGVLAITGTDLYPQDEWNFVFGLANLYQGVGIWSFNRFGEAGTEIFQERLLKVAIHETGHMFGIKHCMAFECLMNSSNNLYELDEKPLWFCPECSQKVAYTRELELADYFEDLASHAKAMGFNDAHKYWTESAEIIKGMK